MEKNIENSQVSILIEIDGKVHLIGIAKENLSVINILIKNSIEFAIPTNKTQNELCDFLGYKGN